MNRTGIALVRYAVNLFSYCNESFNENYSAVELLKIADACQKSSWDIAPDHWDERQISECINLGAVPDWKENDNGKLIPIYHKEN